MAKKSDRYQELVQSFPLRPLRSDRELERASKIVFGLAVRERLSRGEQDYLEVLSDLIEKYEDRYHPLGGTPPGPETLAYLIEENQLTLSQLAEATGIKISALSEILRGKRSLNVRHIERLCAYFRVEPGLFIHAATAARPRRTARPSTA